MVKEPNFELFSMFIMLPGYVYTLVYAHILLARVDRQVKIGRHSSGEITHATVVTAKLKFKGAELKKALLLLRVNQAITYLFFILLIFDMIAKLNLTI